VLNTIKMIRASLRLTEWLQAKYGISDKNVIGHAESLSSPYHHEAVARLKTQTHGDWPRRFMVRYRRALAAG
jgi:N-acetylmuramoyl-L-alanine amidase